jgi:transposase
VPAVPSSIIEPVWDQFAVLLPAHEVVHPLGCHRARIPDRVVFDKLVQVLVFGCAYHRIADETCSASTLRRRRDEWIALGIMDTLQAIALAAYDRMIGLDLADLAVDGCITKAPCGGEVAGRSPVDRANRGSSAPWPWMRPASRLGRSPLQPTAMTRRCWHRRWIRWS